MRLHIIFVVNNTKQDLAVLNDVKMRFFDVKQCFNKIFYVK